MKAAELEPGLLLCCLHTLAFGDVSMSQQVCSNCTQPSKRVLLPSVELQVQDFAHETYQPELHEDYHVGTGKISTTQKPSQRDGKLLDSNQVLLEHNYLTGA